MSDTRDRLRRARGPLTGIALLFLGAAIALFMSTSSSGDSVTAPVSSASIPDELVATSSSPTSYVEPDTTAPETSTPVMASSTTTPTVATTTAAPVTSSTTRPTATTTTTSRAPQPVVWKNVIPALPGGGSASLIEGNDYRYAVNISYPGYQPAALTTSMENSFKSASWTVSVTGTVVTVNKGNVKGTVTITASGSGSKAVLDLRSIG